MAKSFNWYIFAAILAGNCGFAALMIIANPWISIIFPTDWPSKIFMFIILLITGSWLYSYSMRGVINEFKKAI